MSVCLTHQATMQRKAAECQTYLTNLDYEPVLQDADMFYGLFCKRMWDDVSFVFYNDFKIRRAIDKIRRSVLETWTEKKRESFFKILYTYRSRYCYHILNANSLDKLTQDQERLDARDIMEAPQVKNFWPTVYGVLRSLGAKVVSIEKRFVSVCNRGYHEALSGADPIMQLQMEQTMLSWDPFQARVPAKTLRDHCINSISDTASVHDMDRVSDCADALGNERLQELAKYLSSPVGQYWRS